MSRPTKDQSIVIRVTQDEKKTLTQRANERGVKLSEVIRRGLKLK